MAIRENLLFWTTLLILTWTDFCSSQRIDSAHSSCSLPNEINTLKMELSILQEIVRDQAIKIETLEEELKSVQQTLLQSNRLTPTSAEISSTIATTDLPKSLDNRGKEFLLLFMRNHPIVSGSLTIYVTTESEGIINISTSPYLNANLKSTIDKKINFNSESNITLPFDLSCDYLTVEPKAILLQTTEPSSVTIFDSFHKYTNDGTLIIPSDKLSKKYIVSSTKPPSMSPYYFSQFAIGALHEGTNIQIEFKMGQDIPINIMSGTYKNGDIFSISLSRLETFQINHTTDLTGTFITATKPVAVFSGNRCQRLKDTGCSHMVTQLPPTNKLDTHYIVAPFYNNNGTLIQVVSEKENFINSSVGNEVLTWHLNEKEALNMTGTLNEVTVIVSDHPVLVTGFGMGYPYDPFMTVIPGIHQYLSYYKFTVPDGYEENFICVIIPQNSIMNLRINGNSFNKFSTVFQSSIFLEEMFNVSTFQVHNGTFILSTTDNSKFGLTVYGHREHDGYGFAGNFLLSETL